MTFLGNLIHGGRQVVTNVVGFAVENIGEPSTVVAKVTGVLQLADWSSVHGLFEAVLRRLRDRPDLISSTLLLETASNLASGILETTKTNKAAVKSLIEIALDRLLDLITFIDSNLLLKIALKIGASILNATIRGVGSLPVIRDGVFSNDINAATLILIRDQAAELVEFFLDILEAAKCYASANSEDGQRPAEDPHGDYNELDLSQSMNRHAVICQLQRLVKSLIHILCNANKPQKFKDVDMSKKTTLDSDANTKSEVDVKTGVPRKLPEAAKEKWLFVNGIGGELYWLRLACNRLMAEFSRDITGVFNRGDGLLWDIIECSGERNAFVSGTTAGSANRIADVDTTVKNQRDLLERTRSSLDAQELLLGKLRDALNDPTHTYIVMIAHSQGCLILRHVLEDLVNDAMKDETLKLGTKMSQRLCVFTFGNPSLHWMAQTKSTGTGLDGAQGSKGLTPLWSHVLRTEHFANSKDFIAKLGVLSELQSAEHGYRPRDVFINQRDGWAGHLFGTQYSLDYKHYGHPEVKPEDQPSDETSWLLACKGRSMEVAKDWRP